MKNIIVSNVTYQMIAKAARGEFKGQGRQTPSGMWIVPVGEDVFDEIRSRQVVGETFDDTVQRVLMEAAGAAKN